MEEIPNKLNNRYNLTNLSFNRFLVFRYATAIFFFINLYWTILSFETISKGNMLPILLLVIDIAIIIEQTRKYWHPTNQLKVTRIGYGIQIVVNLMAVLLILTGYQQLLFPFINEKGRMLLIVLLLLGCVISFFIEWRAWQIEQDRDSYLTFMKNIQTNMKENR